MGLGRALEEKVRVGLVRVIKVPLSFQLGATYISLVQNICCYCGLDVLEYLWWLTGGTWFIFQYIHPQLGWGHNNLHLCRLNWTSHWYILGWSCPRLCYRCSIGG